MLINVWVQRLELTDRRNRAREDRWDNNGHRRNGSGDAGRGHNGGRGGRRSLDLTVADLGDGLHLGSGDSNGSEEGE
jgi:hypothetical protein